MKAKLKDPKLLVAAVVAVFLLIMSLGLLFGITQNVAQKVAEGQIELKPDLTIGVGETAKASDFVVEGGEIPAKDLKINTDETGEVLVEYEYFDEDGKRYRSNYTVQVVDKTAPEIYGSNYYTLARGWEGDLTDLMLSGDDYDDRPQREIVGAYDLSKNGTYNLEYIITDASGNQAAKPFTLEVIDPKKDSTPVAPGPKLPISEVITKYKTEQTQIGIDVSQWQGEIDWQRVKASGVEFAFVRVGYQDGYNGDYVLDPYYEANMRGAEAAGIPTGVYFYSYANSSEQARQQVAWIAGHLREFRAELGVAYDWENWREFNAAEMSFRKVNQVAQEFITASKKLGHRGWLYSSKNYLEKIWQAEKYANVWLAQYYDRVTYEGDYQLWQMSSAGRVPGINGDVDLDILHLAE